MSDETDAQFAGFSDNSLISLDVTPDDETTHEYLYDTNGNMIVDHNKQIENIKYNHLNLPTFINLGDNKYIEYFYDAAGIKLRQKVFDGDDGLIKTTNYIANFVYENGFLAYILTGDGRLVPEGDNFNYEYFIKDHLGNTRVVVSDNEGVAEVQQESHYYPFGLQLAGQSWQNPLQTAVNKIKFQGQEIQDELDLGWYHFKWRMHSPEIGRFMTVDPLAEKYYYNSPYAFSENVVINAVELEGLEKSYVFSFGGADDWTVGDYMEQWSFGDIEHVVLSGDDAILDVVSKLEEANSDPLGVAFVGFIGHGYFSENNKFYYMYGDGARINIKELVGSLKKLKFMEGAITFSTNCNSCTSDEVEYTDESGRNFSENQSFGEVWSKESGQIFIGGNDRVSGAGGWNHPNKNIKFNLNPRYSFVKYNNGKIVNDKMGRELWIMDFYYKAMKQARINNIVPIIPSIKLDKIY